MKDLSKISDDLVNWMQSQREKWFDACLQLISDLNKDQFNIKNTSLSGKTDYIIKSFQLVHILSFIAMQEYISREETSQFTKLLVSNVCNADFNQCAPFIARYTKLKEENRGDKFKEQFLIFSEDIVLSIMDSSSAILLAPAVDATLSDFYTRNLVLAAHAFDDKETSNNLLEGIKRQHGVD